MVAGADRAALRAVSRCVSLILLTGALTGGAAVSNGTDAADSCSKDKVAYVADAPPALAELASDRSWALATGTGVLVAVVDSGVEAGNAHFATGLLSGVNLVPDDGDADGFSDDDGHGTAVAGVIAARPVSGSGVVGLAPNATILPVRVFRSTEPESANAGVGADSLRLAAGIRYAVDHGAKVVNVSMSTTQDLPELRAAVDHAEAAGALVVASAGNRNTTEETADSLRYPAAYPTVIGVAAANASGVVTDDSIHGPQVDLVAPGQSILTASFAAGDCVYAADKPSSSFATGYASAAAALVVERYPQATPAQWRYRLLSSALRSEPDHRDDRSGWGLVQPYAALTDSLDGSVRGPQAPGAMTEPAASPAPAVRANSAPSPMAATTQSVLIALLVGVVVLLAIATLRRVTSVASGSPRLDGSSRR